MPMDRNLNYELNEVWHSWFWCLYALCQSKNRFFRLEN